jgi:hypothetical protein
MLVSLADRFKVRRVTFKLSRAKRSRRGAYFHGEAGFGIRDGKVQKLGPDICVIRGGAASSEQEFETVLLHEFAHHLDVMRNGDYRHGTHRHGTTFVRALVDVTTAYYGDAAKYDRTADQTWRRGTTWTEIETLIAEARNGKS